jgi:hypothetical protein
MQTYFYTSRKYWVNTHERNNLSLASMYPNLFTLARDDCSRVFGGELEGGVCENNLYM